MKDGRKRTDRAWAVSFYTSTGWRKCREAYAKSRGNLCERCAARGLIVPGDEVHHKERLTPENIDNPTVTLNWNNLELLCKACHLDEHERRAKMRTDASGHVEL